MCILKEEALYRKIDLYILYIQTKKDNMDIINIIISKGNSNSMRGRRTTRDAGKRIL